MRPDLSPRLLALPPDVRTALMGAAGPGWYVWDSGRTPTLIERSLGAGIAGVWWPVSPAASVAAVLGISIAEAYERMATRMRDGFVICVDDPRPDDSSAALSIIEAHVANRSPA